MSDAYSNMANRIKDGEFTPNVEWIPTPEGRRTYHEEERNCINNFRSALEEEYQVKNNPKAEKCWDMAWEDGHASGYADVLSHYSQYVELIK